MARYVGDLITETREDTDNVEFTVDSSGNVTAGISTEAFLRFFNYALYRLQGLLIQRRSTIFRVSEDIDIVANQSTYTPTGNVWLKENIVDVKYSSDGQESNFFELREIAESYRNYNTSSTVRAYTRRAGSIIVSPVPSISQGKIRIVYNRTLDRLDIRRGQIDGVTVTSGVLQANSLSLTDANEANRINGVTDKYLCVVDTDGNVNTYNVPYTSLATSSPFDFTHGAFTLGSGESISINDYITVGKNTTTHLTTLNSEAVERYLQLYAAVKVFRRDSSTDANEAARELSAVEREILDSYQGIQEDEMDVQIEDPSVLDIGDIYYG